MKYLTLTLPNGQTVNPPAGVPQGGVNAVSKAIGSGITIMLIATTVLSLIFLIVGGIQWVQSGGDKQKLAGARARITYAIIGLIVALVSFFIVGAVGGVFNITLL